MATKTAEPKKAQTAPKTNGKADQKHVGSNPAVSVQPILNQQKDAPAPLQRYGTVASACPSAWKPTCARKA